MVGRVLFLCSASLLGTLAVATLASPVLVPALRPPTVALPETARVQLLERPDGWVLQYSFVNVGPDPATFLWDVTFDREEHRASPSLKPGESYVAISEIPRDQVPSGLVHFTLTRVGDPTPIEDMTLHLAAAGQPRSAGAAPSPPDSR